MLPIARICKATFPGFAASKALVQHPVSEHLSSLRRLIDQIRERKTGVSDPLTLHALETMVRNAELAIAHYELALKMERELMEEKKRFNGIFAARPVA